MQYSETAIVQPLAHPTSAYLLIYISVNKRRGQNSSFSSQDISFSQHNHHILHSVSMPAIHHSRSRLHHWTSSSSHNSHTHHPPALLSPAPIKLPSNPPPHQTPSYPSGPPFPPPSHSPSQHPCSCHSSANAFKYTRNSTEIRCLHQCVPESKSGESIAGR